MLHFLKVLGTILSPAQYPGSPRKGGKILLPEGAAHAHNRELLTESIVWCYDRGCFSSKRCCCRVLFRASRCQRPVSSSLVGALGGLPFHATSAPLGPSLQSCISFICRIAFRKCCRRRADGLEKAFLRTCRCGLPLQMAARIPRIRPCAAPAVSSVSWTHPRSYIVLLVNHMRPPLACGPFLHIRHGDKSAKISFSGRAQISDAQPLSCVLV